MSSDKSRRSLLRKQYRGRRRKLAMESLEHRLLLAGDVVFRINAGGAELGDTPAWQADSSSSPSAFRQEGNLYSSDSPIDLSHPSIPPNTPAQLFQTERWDPNTGGEMKWSFPVSPGSYEVRLYFAEIYDGAFAPGARTFDVASEGQLVLDDIDVFAEAGSYAGLVKSFVVDSDASLDIEFLHQVENPAIKAIEILSAAQSNQLLASLGQINFGKVAPNTTASRTLELRNAGIAGDPSITIDPAHIDFASGSTDDISILGVDSELLVLAPGETQTLTITWTPPTDSLLNDVLRIPSSADNSPVEIPVLGEAAASQAAARILFDSGQPLSDASTSLSNAIQVFNESPDSEQITSITVDLSSALLPDVVFDPMDAAGDIGGVAFQVDSGGSATGYDSHLFSTEVDDGYRQITINFSDFDPSESFVWSADIDPTSVRGAAGSAANHAGAVAGIELIGSNITVRFNDGTVLQGVVGPVEGSDIAGQAVVSGAALPRVSLGISGIADLPADVTSSEQVVALNGPPGASVELFLGASGLFLDGVPGGGFDIDEYESNKLLEWSSQTVQLDPNGMAALPVTLYGSHEGGLNLLAAAVKTDDGRYGPFAQTTLRLVDGEPQVPPNDPPPSEAAGNIVYRVNAGGSAIADSPPWESDAAYQNALAASSKTASSNQPVAVDHPSLRANIPAEVFASERWDDPSGAEMAWSFDVEPGQYDVELYFAETYSGTQSVGARVFDVFIEGQIVLDDYDVFAEVGGYQGVAKTFTVDADDLLTISFGHVTENPAIKGIEIRRLDESGNQLGASSSAIDFGAVLVGNTLSSDLILSNRGKDGDPSIQLDVDQIQIQGAEAAAFSWQSDASGTLELKPGETLALDIQVTATSAETFTADLIVPHGGDNSPLTIPLAATGVSEIPIGFRKTTLAGASLAQPTTLQFGPDDRLYVGQQNGQIAIYTVERLTDGSYQVAASETIDLIAEIPNHDDDGSVNPSVSGRLVTGMLVTGTSEFPVIYVASSDPRIGGGDGATDLNLDTNSGIISRLTWDGSQWHKIDLVRGLPRSEENHTANGMQLDADAGVLYVAQGGNTNMGAPSNNFAFLPEFALSAAILSIDLNAIGNTTYDLPTLDDEDRAGEVDANDPFGGNDGKNQAKLVPGGPVQVYAPGFRNPYDLVITSDGRFYTIDNGPNAGWGDVPKQEGPAGQATNEVSEPGTTLGDSLHFISGPGYYGGHANPTRSNPANTFNATNPQSPVSAPNPIESDYRTPGTENGSLHVFPASTNGLVEYRASSFQGSMRGDLLAASFDNTVYRIVLNDIGNAATLVEPLFHSVGTIPLDVTAQNDDGVFPGTVWVTDIVSSEIIVFEPNDFEDGGPEVITPDDSDGDGYTDDDELANGTNPGSSADVPPDADGDLLSDLTDADDDNDGILDTSDPFALDPSNGQSRSIGFTYEWENDGSQLGGLLNLGFTGLMTNGTDDYSTLYQPAALTAGGAAGVLTIDDVDAGDAAGSLNSQTHAFQLGFNASNAVLPFTAHTRVLSPFGAGSLVDGEFIGLQIGLGDQDNYLKVGVSGQDGFVGIGAALEVDGVYSENAFSAIDTDGVTAVDLMIIVDPVLQTLQPAFQIRRGESVDEKLELGEPIELPDPWTDNLAGLAVGIIATSPDTSEARPATWDRIGVEYNDAAFLPEVLYRVNAGGSTLAGTPEWSSDSAAAPAAYHDATSAQSQTAGTQEAIDTSHPSIPLNTPAALFETERWDSASGTEMQWSFPVTPGNYVVRLYFAETYSGTFAPGARVFDVLIENQLVLDDYDVYSLVGANAGIVESFTITADETVDIAFTHEVENPAIKGIEILSLSPDGEPLPDDPPPPADDTEPPADDGGTSAPSTLYRVNAGGAEVGTSAIWSADTAQLPSEYHNGSAAQSKTFSTTDSIDMSHSSLPDGVPEALFQTQRWDSPGGGEMAWAFPVQPGEYEVRLYFAEIYDGAMAPGSREFDVWIENELKLSQYDIFADVGGNTAVMKSFVVTADSSLDVQFGHVTENPAVMAIEVVDVASSAPFFPVMAADHPPELTGPESASQSVGTLATYGFSATDPDGDTLAFTTTGFPSFVTPADDGAGTLILTIDTAAAPVGEHPMTIRVESDTQPPLPAERQFVLNVVSADVSESLVPVYRINAGGGAVPEQGWISDIKTDTSGPVVGDVIDIGSRLELFVDQYLFDSMIDAGLELHQPELVPGSTVAASYPSVTYDGQVYRHYYRDHVVGAPASGNDGTNNEVTRYEESTNAVDWVQPELGLFSVDVAGPNNVVLANQAPDQHNFMAFYDANPAAPNNQRFKALAGLVQNGGTGLHAYGSADGVHWNLLSPNAVITSSLAPPNVGQLLFDSNNLAFWSEHEQRYVAYFRVWVEGFRSVARVDSPDFLNWENPQLVQANLPDEHIYSSGIAPYPTAPHIYIGMPTQFTPNQGTNTQVLLMTSRDGVYFDRSFGQQPLLPALDGNRQNYVAPTFLPTGEHEVSIIAQSGSRYRWLHDRIASVDATGVQGEVRTKPLRFSGSRLIINYLAADSGSVRVELQDADGQPIPGFSLADSDSMTGDRPDATVTWNGSADLSALSGKTVRVRLLLDDADVFSIRFDAPPEETRLQVDTVASPQGGVVAVPVSLNLASDESLTLTDATLHLQFDADRLSLNSVRPGEGLAGLTLTASVDQAAGVATITLQGGSVTLASGDSELVLLDFAVDDAAPPHDYSLNLLGQHEGTSTMINGGSVVLSSSPTDKDDDPSDGRIRVSGPYFNLASQSETATTMQAIDMSHPSVPDGVPNSVMQSERWDPPAGEEMSWRLAVEPGTYEVRLYFAETHVKDAGDRVFDVLLEGVRVLDDYDILADVGSHTAVVKTFRVAADSTLDIAFEHEVENPLIRGIEVLRVVAPSSGEGEANPLDVNRDGVITPRDALFVLDRLQRGERTPAVGDVNGDGLLTPADMLSVVSALNQRGEGEAAEGAQLQRLDSLQRDPLRGADRSEQRRARERAVDSLMADNAELVSDAPWLFGLHPHASIQPQRRTVDHPILQDMPSELSEFLGLSESVGEDRLSDE